MGRRWAFLALLAFWVVLGARPVPCPEATALMERVEAAYRDLGSYYLRLVLIVHWKGLLSSVSVQRVWVTPHASRTEHELVEPIPEGFELRWEAEIKDRSQGRRWMLYRGGTWVEEELNEDAPGMELVLVPTGREATFTSVRGGHLNGRSVWIVEMVATTEEEFETRGTLWVDQETLFVVKSEGELEGLGISTVMEVAELIPNPEVSPDLFRVPAGSRVVVRTPISQEAQALMRRAVEDHQKWTSFFVRKRVREEGRETEELVWFDGARLRVEETSFVPFPGLGVQGIGAVRVTVHDYETGARYTQSSGQWRGIEGTPLPPSLRRSMALSTALGLDGGFRFISLEEAALGGRPVWLVAGEPVIWREGVEKERRRWWIDRETLRVLQYEEPITMFMVGLDGRRTVVRVHRIEEFKGNVEVPADKFTVPEGIPLERPGAFLQPLEPTGPGEKADRPVAWEPFSQQRLEEAKAQGRPVILYFAADWCLPCLDLEEEAFRDKRVVEAVEPFVRLKVDLTHWDTAENARLRREYKVSAVPLLVILDRQGKESGRITGSVPAFVILSALRTAAR